MAYEIRPCSGAASERPSEAWLLDVAVRPEVRGRGIALLLLDASTNALRAAGVRSIKATVSPSNAASRRLLSTRGFAVVDDVDDYFGPGQDRLVMYAAI